MEEKKKSRLPVIAALIFFVVLAGLYVYIYVLPGMDDSKNQGDVVRYAKVQDQAQAKCIAARSETVYSSGGPGSVSYYSAEGAKTRVGSKVADVYGPGGPRSFYTSSTGFISYYLDGYETYFAPESFGSLDPDELAELDDIIPKSDKPSAVEDDVPIYKFIGSDTWYLLIIVPAQDRGKYSPTQKITVELSDGVSLPAVITSVINGTRHQLAVASISRYYEKFCEIRTTEATIISSVIEGLVVPTSAVTTDGENVGVYVLGLDGEYSFKPIEILMERDQDTLISDGGSVKLYDEVLKDARNYQK